MITTKRLLILSLIVNLVFGYYVTKKVLWKYNHEWNKENRKETKGKVAYSFGRNTVFNSLPIDTSDIVFLGNSLTQNFELFEIFKNSKLKNRGIAGDITKGIIQRLTGVIESKPKKIFLEIGINDLIYNFNIEAVKNNYRAIINTIKQKSPASKIYIQSLFPTNKIIFGTQKTVSENVKLFNTFLADLAKSENLEYIDLYSQFVLADKLNPKYDSGDHLHLNGEGYLLWAKLIEKNVNE